MLELAVTFRADADHVGHDSASDRFLLGMMLGVLLAGDRTCRVWKILDAAHRNHNAFRDGLLW